MSSLGLLFTEGISLETWVSQGLFSREKQIYEEHLKMGHFEKIIWFTYGRNDRAVYEKLLAEKKIDERIIVVPMPKIFIGGHLTHLYSYLLPYIQKKYCKEIDIIKTNQMGGAWTAAIIQKKYKKLFLLRTGYTYSLFLNKKINEADTAKNKRLTVRRYHKYKKIEKEMYDICDIATVSSSDDKEYICSNYNVPDNKVTVLTNYIDCDMFCKINKNDRKNRFLFVGRLDKQKNLYNTIQAIAECNFGLDIVGNGSMRNELEMFAHKRGYDVVFHGFVDNKELPKIYNDFKYYILASEYEGMPKTLLEAMACGALCFGTNVAGIKEVIQDKINGYLIPDTSIQSIKETIKNGINEDSFEMLTDNAVHQIYSNNSLQNVTLKEWDLIDKLRH